MCALDWSTRNACFDMIGRTSRACCVLTPDWAAIVITSRRAERESETAARGYEKRGEGKGQKQTTE